ncbi:unnamed protein product [Peniophora sp. CBMAI 1063]|nr:unnamed protein product [Peniophora sp. CBMAI 1063]
MRLVGRFRGTIVRLAQTSTMWTFTHFTLRSPCALPSITQSSSSYSHCFTAHVCACACAVSAHSRLSWT